MAPPPYFFWISPCRIEFGQREHARALSQAQARSAGVRRLKAVPAGAPVAPLALSWEHDEHVTDL